MSILFKVAFSAYISVSDLLINICRMNGKLARFINLHLTVLIWFAESRICWFPKWASLVAQLVKNPPTMQETWARSLGWEDPLEKGKAIHSSILAWRVQWGGKELDSRVQSWLSNFYFQSGQKEQYTLKKTEWQYTEQETWLNCYRIKPQLSSLDEWHRNKESECEIRAD